MTHFLIIDAWMPSNGTDSASTRLLALMRLLREQGIEVTFLPDDLQPERGALDRMAAMGVRVPSSSELPDLESHLRDHGHRYDIALLSRAYVADKHLDAVRRHAPQAVRVFDTLDLTYLRLFRWAKKERNAFLLKNALASKRQELRLMRESDLTLVVSTYEVQILAGDCPEAQPLLLPTVHTVEADPPPFESRNGLLFVGGFTHEPNADAMRYYTDEILPRVRKALPGVPTTVVGVKPPDWLVDRQADDFVVTGQVPELRPYLDRCRLSIAPIRFGAGVKGKVLESLGAGLPVVGTADAFEGMPTVHELHVLRADDPAAFSAAVALLHRDERLWQQLSDNGRALVRDEYSETALGRRLAELLDRALRIRSARQGASAPSTDPRP